MQEVQNLQGEIVTAKEKTQNKKPATWKAYLPAILAIVGAFLMLGLRLEIGAGFISDGALMMVALACYI